MVTFDMQRTTKMSLVLRSSCIKCRAGNGALRPEGRVNYNDKFSGSKHCAGKRRSCEAYWRKGVVRKDYTRQERTRSNKLSSVAVQAVFADANRSRLGLPLGRQVVDLDEGYSELVVARPAFVCSAALPVGTAVGLAGPGETSWDVVAGYGAGYAGGPTSR